MVLKSVVMEQYVPITSENVKMERIHKTLMFVVLLPKIHAVQTQFQLSMNVLIPIDLDNNGCITCCPFGVNQFTSDCCPPEMGLCIQGDLWSLNTTTGCNECMKCGSGRINSDTGICCPPLVEDCINVSGIGSDNCLQCCNVTDGSGVCIA